MMINLKILQALLLLSLTLFCGCYFTSHEFLQNDKPLVLKQKIFLNNTVSVLLPEDGWYVTPDKYYSKSVYSKWLGFSPGDYPISRVTFVCRKYIPEPYDLCTNTLKKGAPPQEVILYVSSNVSSNDYTKKFRRGDLFINGNSLHLLIATSYNAELLPDKALQKYRMDEDDKLFEKTLDTILIEVGGKWIKPPIVHVKANDIAW